MCCRATKIEVCYNDDFVCAAEPQGMMCVFTMMTSYLLQSRKELAKSVSFHSDTIPEEGKAAAAPQAGATAAVTLGSAYVKVGCTDPCDYVWYGSGDLG